MSMHALPCSSSRCSSPSYIHLSSSSSLICLLCIFSSSAAMAQLDQPTPSLSGVLVVLNLVFALIWIPFLNSVDDAAGVFHAVLFINTFTTSWWLCMNTSLRRHVRWLNRTSLSVARELKFLALVFGDAMLQLGFAVAAEMRRRHCRDRQTIIMQARNYRPDAKPRTKAEELRIALRAMEWDIPTPWEFIVASYKASTYAPRREQEELSAQSKLLSKNDTVTDEHCAAPPLAPPSRCNSTDTLVEDLGTPRVGIVQEAKVDSTTITPATSDENLFMEPSAAADGTIILHPFRPSNRPSYPYPSMRDLSPHFAITIPTSSVPLASLSDAQLPEVVQLHRDLRISTTERDMYRTRAYQLAMRLDEFYTANAQNACALEEARGELAEAQRALLALEAQRHDLEVALAAADVPSAGRTETGSPDVCFEDATAAADNAVRSPSPCEELVLYPRSPSKKRAGSDDRPLLLPRTAELIVDTPPRARTETWASNERPKSRLVEILYETKRHARSFTAHGQGAVWDAQRTASARPLFSVLHQDSVEGGRTAPGNGSPSATPEIVVESETDGIIEDLHASRPPTSPPDTPVGTTSPPNTPVVEQDVDGGHAHLAVMKEAPALVCIARQPLGPPPSPCGAAAALARPADHYWRGRWRQLASEVPEAAATAAAQDDPFGGQPYLDSMLPGRVRTRQATARAHDGGPPSGAPWQGCRHAADGSGSGEAVADECTSEWWAREAQGPGTAVRVRAERQRASSVGWERDGRDTPTSGRCGGLGDVGAYDSDWTDGATRAAYAEKAEGPQALGLRIDTSSVL
ncbi:hypothetical protein BD413DRAFT_636416 [Trametes elegans]|nr:hypothetical protein BD413DRAFT_636416 [Trametes elegans]